MKKRLFAVVTASLMLAAAMPGVSVNAFAVDSAEASVSAPPDTEAIELDWLPETEAEYQDFVNEYGHLSVHDRYIIYCDEINYSTGAEVVVKQSGDGEVKKVKEYDISDELAPPGTPSKVVMVFVAVTPGDIQLTISQSKYWDPNAELTEKESGTYVVKDDYTIEEKTNSDEFMMGDVNNDGSFNVSDVVLLQKWLLAVPDTHLANWKAANFCDDDRLNVFDLCLMKRALIEQRQQRQITVEDIISLSKKGYDLTVADFASFKGEDIGSGLYVMKYEVAGREDQYYLLVGSDGSDKPDYAKLVNIENDGKWDEIDIRSEEFQNAVEIYENWNKGTDTEENRASARTLGDYALEKLKDGTYSLDTVIDSENAAELMDEGTAALMDKDEFTSMEFLDKHTVMINLNYGLLGVQGYLVTDGTLTFEPDTQVSVPDNGFDGNVINIEWADGNLYYFTAGL